ncbi:hypothetical protein N0V88_004119 [Collariella sp. IMI 366227]|nr:hypothetical protein N0V88_004119 [Collariella sp. IMI 366227]
MNSNINSNINSNTERQQTALRQQPSRPDHITKSQQRPEWSGSQRKMDKQRQQSMQRCREGKNCGHRVFEYSFEVNDSGDEGEEG